MFSSVNEFLLNLTYIIGVSGKQTYYSTLYTSVSAGAFDFSIQQEGIGTHGKLPPGGVFILQR